MKRSLGWLMILASCTPFHSGGAGVVDIDFARANRLYQEGRVAESLPFYAKAVEKEPRNPVYRYYYGVALLEAGDTAGAQQSFETILSSNPGDVLAADALGSLFMARNEPEKALEVYARLEKAAPAYASLARTRRAAAYLMLSETDSSFAEASRALTESPFSPDAWYLLASYYAQKGDRDRSLSYLEKALDLEPSLGARARRDTMFKSLWQDPVFTWMVKGK